MSKREARERALVGSRTTFRSEIGDESKHVVASVKYLWGRIDANRSLGLAAEMAFWLFLSLLPLAAVAGLLAAKFAVHDSALTSSLLESLPSAARGLVEGELGKVAAWNGGKVGVTAVAMFVWLASSGIHAIFDGIELESEAAPRPWWRKRAVALMACVGLALGTFIVAMLGAGLEATSHLLSHGETTTAHPWLDSTVGHWVGRLIGAGVGFAMVLGLYWVSVPPRTRKHMPLWPGAALAVALQGVIGVTYGFYIQKMGDGGAYQAGLASIGITLMALYLFCFVLLVGIELNQVLGERRRAKLEARRDAMRANAAIPAS